jgi:hypothetical protein
LTWQSDSPFGGTICNIGVSPGDTPGGPGGYDLDFSPGDSFEFDWAGSVITGPYNSDQTFTLQCMGGVTAPSVTLFVTAGSPPPAWLNVATGSSCQSVSATWGFVPNALSYNLYRNTVNLPTWGPDFTESTGLFPPHTDSGLAAGTPYYYWVTAVGFGGESGYTPAPSNATGGITPVSCSNPGNLSTSDKDIVSINGNNVTPAPSQCNGTDALPASDTINLADSLGFQINLCNSGTGTSSNITLTDNMINLIAPTAGWNVKYNGVALSQGGGVNQYQVSGSTPNQSLTVNLSGTSIVGGGGGHLTYQAQTAVPGGFTGNVARFQNSFCISYASTSNASILSQACNNTPLLPFYIGNGSPIIKEVP